jgi:hypothetical protein
MNPVLLIYGDSKMKTKCPLVSHLNTLKAVCCEYLGLSAWKLLVPVLGTFAVC